MAIQTYSDLQASAAAWLIRGDLTSRIPDFITLAESRLNRVLRTRRGEMDVSLTSVPSSRFIALPAAYAEALTCWISVSGDSIRRELRFVDPAELTTDTTAGRPYGWTIDGANLAFERPCDQAYAVTLRCLEKYALSEAAPTNSLLTDYPDAYLFATLSEAAPFLRDADLAAAYETKLISTISEINAKDARSRAPQQLVTEVGMMQRLSHARSYDIQTDRLS